MPSNELIDQHLDSLSTKPIKILDVGGGASPYPKATEILDLFDHDFVEKFSYGDDSLSAENKTWTKFDICSRELWPYGDDTFDFSICSHTLEDIKDPLWVCKELTRISKAGYIPIIHTITPFLVLRALDQIKIDFVYNKLNCNIISVGASNDYTKLGTTHHCFEDISILSSYKDINLFIPSNAEEFKYLLKKNYNNKSVNYFRISEKKIEHSKFDNRYLKNKVIRQNKI